LSLLAALLREDVRLGLCLDALRDDAEPEIVGHGNGRAHDSGVLGILGDADDEATVDLDETGILVR
jgi:hypothetical protein